MTLSSKWLPVVTLAAGCAAGWLMRGGTESQKSALQLNAEAAVLDIDGRIWKFADLPAELRTQVHIAFLQSNGILRTVLEDFAARVVRSGGQVSGFDWQREIAAGLDTAKLRKIYDTAMGFKSQGDFASPQVQKALRGFAAERERSSLISEEVGKLVAAKKIKFLWDLPLGTKLEEPLSDFPLIQIGSDKAQPAAGEVQVMFSFAQPHGESVFNQLYRLASDLQRRLSVRLLWEYSGLPKEKVAIETVQCMIDNKFPDNELWAVLLRMLRDTPSLPENTDSVDLSQAFAGNADLQKRVSGCARKPLPDKVFSANSAEWSKIRQNPLPMLFHDARRVSEYDPRGVEGVLRAQLVR